MHLLSTTYIIFSIVATALAGFDPGSKANLAVYWGQNSAGKQETQTRLSTYCTDSDIDVIVIAFIDVVNTGTGRFHLNLANQGYNCTDSSPQYVCLELEADIIDCQAKGKTVLLSMGGERASGEKGYANEVLAKQGAQMIWDTFGPDQSKGGVFRPFGSASVDGFDLAFETNVLNIGPFAKALKELMKTSNKQQYLTAAPMCANPNEFPKFDDPGLDMVFVQFYNDAQCDQRANFNFKDWNGWAKNQSTTFFVGLPAGVSAAQGPSYVIPGNLSTVLENTNGLDRMKGAMLWDASQAWSNENYHKKVKDALKALPKRKIRRSPRFAVKSF
ncbi:Chitinase 2 [Neocucurbitaria cava]|uniref:Chitinase 2 n=1 Tax=Neocucurbitaria cava TaxID=798079 RepID=A0A9W8Y661_9PLEO|nr:Chitinase 2 [Neocucurbitaria cava]